MSCSDSHSFIVNLAAVGMIAGAFGSHALKRRPGITADGLAAWGTASHYAVRNRFSCSICF